MGVFSTAAGATPFKPIVTSCASASGDAGVCSTVTPGSGLWELEVSPDGKNAYGSSWNDNALIVFNRDTGTGTLTQAACFNSDGSAGCTAARGLLLPDGIELARNGEFLYVASWDGPVAAFDRNPSNGVLTQLPGTDGCISFDGSFNGLANQCIDGRGLTGATDLVKSGDFLYVGGFASVFVLEIEADGSMDQPAGVAGCLNEDGTDGCFDGHNVGFARQITVTPDGAYVYVPTSDDQGVLALSRNATTGGLTQAAGTGGCVTFDGSSGACAAEPSIGGSVLTAEASTDGKQLYLMHDAGITVFAVQQNGSLVKQSCINDGGSGGCVNGRNVAQMGYAAFTPDGDHLIVNALGGGNGVSIFRRDADGNLTSVVGPDGCISASGNAVDAGAPVPGGCIAHPAADGHGHVEVVSNSRFYVASYSGDSVMAARADYYPECANGSATVPHNTSVPVALSCTDRNDDPITMAISQAPVAGNLGAVDQAQSRVFYNPFSGYTGADSFKYTGTAAGLTSQPATVTITVEAPPPAPPPPPGGVDGDGDGFTASQECNDSDPKINPKAQEIPGNLVDENCDTIAAPFPRVNSGVSTAGLAFRKGTKFSKIRITQVPAGGKVQMRCKAKKRKACPFRKKNLKVKGGKANGMTVLKKKRRKKGLLIRTGATLEIRITAPNMIGKVLRYKIKKRKYPTAQTLCLPPGASRPARCS